MPAVLFISYDFVQGFKMFLMPQPTGGLVTVWYPTVLLIILSTIHSLLIIIYYTVDKTKLASLYGMLIVVYRLYNH